MKSQNSVYAGAIYSDGTTVPMDSFVTVEKLPATFQSLAASYAVTLKGKVVSGKVIYSNRWIGVIRWIEKEVGSRSSFAYYLGMTVQDPSADYSITFEGEIVSMYLKVSANILQ